MSISTEHNGYKIVYSENGNSWTCFDLNIEASSLSALKQKINKIDADARRINVPVVALTGYDRVFGTATLIEGDSEVWIFADKRRTKHKMKDVIFDAPENRAVIDDVRQNIRSLRSQISAQEQRIHRLPRVTKESLLAAGAERAA